MLRLPRCAHILFLWLLLIPSAAYAQDASLGELHRQFTKTRKSHRSLAPLARLYGLRRINSVKKFQKTVSQLLAINGTDPRVRYLVTRLQASLLRGRFALNQAKQLLTKNGVLMGNWWVKGPVSQDSANIEEAFNPTQSNAFWDASRDWPMGVLPMDALMSPDSIDMLAAYAVRDLWSNKTQRIRIFAAYKNDAEIAVNGRAVVNGAAVLRPGWNRISVLSKQQEGRDWSLSIRLSEPSGRPFSLSSKGRSPLLSKCPAGQVAGHKVAQQLGALWDQEASPQHLHDRARVLHWLGASPNLDSLFDAADSSDDQALLWEAALLAKKSDRSINYLRRLRQLHPKAARIRLKLAEKLLERGQSYEATKEVQAVLSEDGKNLRALLMLSDLQLQFQVAGLAQRAMESLFAGRSDTPWVVDRLAEVYQSRRLTEKALATYELLSKLNNQGGNALYQTSELMKSLGRSNEARQVTEQLLELRPDIPGNHLSAATTAFDSGHPVKALMWLGQARALFPHNVALANAQARVFLDLGRKAEGTEAARQSLKLRPRQPELREQLTFLDRTRVAYEDAFRIDPASLLSAPFDSGSNGEYLLSQRVHRVFDDGTQSTWVQQVFRVNRSAGSGRRAWQVSYDPSRQSVEIIRAERLDRTGKVIGTAQIGVREESESWSGMYYEQKSKVIRFSNLKAGEVLSVEYRTDEFGRSLYGGLVGDLAGVQEVEPQRRARFVWIAPKDLNLQVTMHGANAQPVLKTTDATRQRWQVSFNKVAPLHVEASMPGYTQVAQYLHASVFDDWDAMGRWFTRLAKGQGKITDSMARKAKELTDGAAGDEKKITAIHRFVTRDVRYVALEFGEHGYKPYKAKDVMARRFGDCKDKAWLMKSLLRSLGIESHMVLVRTRRQGKVAAALPSAALFDHAILYVPKIDRYLDATATYHSVHELPAQDQGASALLIAGKESRYVTLPVGRSSTNQFIKDFRFVQTEEGWDLAARMEFRGLYAAFARERFATAAQRKEKMEQMLNREYPGSQVEKVEFSNLEPSARPCTALAQAALPASSNKRLQLLPRGHSLVRRLAPHAQRTHDLVFEYAYEWRWRYGVSLNGGNPLSFSFEDASITSDFGTISVKGGEYAELTLSIDMIHIPVSRYAEFRAFLIKGDELIHRMSTVTLP